MTSSNNCLSPGLTLGLDFETSQMQVVSAVIDQCLFPDEMSSRQEKSQDHADDTKHTMESLCKSFLKKYENTDVFFEPITLANDFNAKLRRVYDMTNILEGSGIIEKVEKSTYKWNTSVHNLREAHVERNDWCSLKTISSELKQLFNTIRKSFTCHELYDIMTSGRKNKFNPSTIKRRIYECCKVFLITGLIKKAGKTFYNARLSQQDIQLQAKKKNQDNSDNFSIKIQDQNFDCIEKKPKSSFSQTQTQIEPSKNNLRDVNTNSLIQQERKSIIKKIVDDLKNQQDLYKFIADLSQQYKHKNVSNERYCVEAKNENENKFIGLNSLSSDDKKTEIDQKRKEKYFSPQNHRRTIILSSPLKVNAPLMFSPNSNFCSFSLNSIFESFHDFKCSLEVKGK